MAKKMKYDIELIKQMRLEGKTLKQIAEYYSVKENSLYKWLKRRGILFSKLPLKCKYCNKIFYPNELHRIFCSSTCAHFAESERAAKDMREQYRKYGDKHPDLNRDDKNIQYHNALWFLESKKSIAVCEFCGNDDENQFQIIEGNCVCLKCGLVYK